MKGIRDPLRVCISYLPDFYNSGSQINAASVKLMLDLPVYYKNKGH